MPLDCGLLVLRKRGQRGAIWRQNEGIGGPLKMDLWNTSKPITEIPDHDISIPAWIEIDISPYTVAAICQDGCASGAYMPAVTYNSALQTMQAHGDAVLEFIDNNGGELPDIEGLGWAEIASAFLSRAVELWAQSVEPELEALDYEQPEEE